MIKFYTNSLISLSGTMRLPFLVLTPACVVLGLGTAYFEQQSFNHVYFWLVLAGALAAHISVNTFNEYFDYKSGLDKVTRRTPFSGGSGTLPEKPELARYTLILALISMLITIVIGLYFISIRGMALLPLGLAGLLIIAGYTPWITRHPLLCLITPGLGFGPLMVMGTHFVLTGTYSWSALIASLVPFFLVNNLLLLNQYPDIEADRRVGRKHFPMQLGLRKATYIYALFLVLAYLSLIIGVITGILPNSSFAGLLTLFLAIPGMVGIYRYADDIKKLMPYMGMNVIINISTPVLISIGLFI